MSRKDGPYLSGLVERDRKTDLEVRELGESLAERPQGVLPQRVLPQRVLRRDLNVNLTTTAPHCTTLHHTATHCNTLHDTSPLALSKQASCVTPCRPLPHMRYATPSAAVCATIVADRAAASPVSCVRLLHVCQCL